MIIRNQLGKYSSREVWVVFLFILTCSLLLSYDYYQKVDSPKVRSRIELHDEIINGTAPSPYQYRVLIPFTTNMLRGVFSFTGTEQAFLISYFIYDFLAIAFSFTSIYIYLRIWFTLEQSLIGILLVAVVMPANFKYHYFQPWSLLEIGFFASGLYFIYYSKMKTLAITIFFASLNRETAVFIPTMYFLYLLKEQIKEKGSIFLKKTLWVKCIGLFAIWVAIFIGLRVVFGTTTHVVNLEELIQRNLKPENLGHTFVAFIMFLGFFWIFVLKGYKQAPEFVRTSTWLLPLYVITLLFWGAWYETRVLMSLYPIFISLGLSAAFPASVISSSSDIT